MMQKVLFGFGVAAALVGGQVSAQAVTCEQVRSLTRAQQDYYAKKFGITAAQRQEIYLRCYKNYDARQRRAAN
jgi:hypothetical protein